MSIVQMKKNAGRSLSQSVVKAMSVFGGVQVLGILCSLVRTKLVALWIGAAGVGVFALYNAALDMINTVSQLGMRNSAVRDIASADRSRISVVTAVVRRWSWALGLFGALLTLSLSPLLSRWTFGDDDHVLGFITLSVAVFLSSLTSGELAILQGMKRLNRLAKASVWGTVAGVLVSIPMFYWLRMDSIVPSLLAYVLATAVAVYFYRDRTVEPAAGLGARDIFDAGKDFIRLGIFMTASAFVSLLVSYLFSIYLNHVGGEREVGLYQAGFTVVNRYVGLIFTAIAMEYYPRLVSAVGSKMRTSLFVSHEMTLALWVLLPVITIFIAADKLVVIVLYDDDFISIIPFMVWAMIGTVFRAVSWCMAFVILARGDGRTYLVTESVSALCCLPLNIVAYNCWGIAGLGYAYCVWYMLYTVIVGFVYFRRYGLRVTSRIALLCFLVLAVSVLAALLSCNFGWIPTAILAAAVSCITLVAMKRLLFR